MIWGLKVGDCMGHKDDVLTDDRKRIDDLMSGMDGLAENEKKTEENIV